MPDPLRVRWATIDDVDELVRLRRIMWESMGMTVTAADDDASAAVLRSGLPTGEFFAAVVDGEPADGEAPYLAACGVGMSCRRLPGPGNPSGRYGYIQSMVTDERARRRGSGRAVLAALLDRFTAEGIVKVDLHATDMGEPLYRSMGFATGTNPELRWTKGGLPAGTMCEP